MILSALLLASCGQAAAPPAGSLAPDPASSGPDAPGSGVIAEPSAPPIDLVDPEGSLTAAEAAMHQEDRSRAGLADVGPGAAAFAAAMDASATRALTKLRTDAATAGALTGQLAGIGPLAPEPGFNTWLVFATLITSLDDFQRDPKDVTVEMPSETVEVEGNTGTISTSMTVHAVASGSKLAVDLTMKMKGQVVDKATGAVLYSIDSIVSGHIDLDFCPDSGGTTTANVRLTSSEIYGSGGGTKGVSKEFTGNVGITVGDDANILKVEGTAQGSEDAKGVGPAGGGEAASTATTRTAGDNIANDGKGQRLPGVPRAITFGGEGTTPAQQTGFFGTMSVFVETMVTAAAKEAEKLWKSGKCLELIIDPKSADVDPDEVKDVKATLKHKIEGNELDKPVTATLVGVKSVEPAGEKQPAPATVTFTAGSKEGDVGRIAFKSVSNRGIADGEAIFTVQATGWDVGFKGTATQVANAALGPEKVSLKATITDLRVTAKDGSLSGSGRLHLKGTHTAGCFTGKLDQVVPLDLEGTLVVTGSESVMRVTFRRPSPSGGTITMSCPQVASWDFPDAAYSELVWFVIGTVDLPAAGGNVAFDRTAVLLPRTGTVAGTFTVTKVSK